MPEKAVTLSEAEQFVVYALRGMAKEGGPAYEVHAVPGRVTLVYPGPEIGRQDEVIGEAGDLEEAHRNLRAAMRLPDASLRAAQG